MPEVVLAALLGLATTSSAMLGVALGLYVPISKRLLGCILAFASGGLISALAIELAFNGAIQLHHQGFGVGASSVACRQRLRHRRHDLQRVHPLSRAKGRRRPLPNALSRIRREATRARRQGVDRAALSLRPAAPSSARGDRGDSTLRAHPPIGAGADPLQHRRSRRRPLHRRQRQSRNTGG